MPLLAKTACSSQSALAVDRAGRCIRLRVCGARRYGVVLTVAIETASRCQLLQLSRASVGSRGSCRQCSSAPIGAVGAVLSRFGSLLAEVPDMRASAVDARVYELNAVIGSSVIWGTAAPRIVLET